MKPEIFKMVTGLMYFPKIFELIILIISGIKILYGARI